MPTYSNTKAVLKMEEKLSAFPDWGLRAQSGEKKKKQNKRMWPENVTSLNMFVSSMLHENSPGQLFFFFSSSSFAQLGEDEGKERKL